MKTRKPLFKVLICVLPCLLLAISLFDLYILFFGQGGYSFGSEFFAPNSIYKSKKAYVTFQLVFITLLSLTMIMTPQRKMESSNCLVYYRFIIISISDAF